MVYRYERKYLVPNAQLDALRNAITSYLRPDVFAKNQKKEYPEYTVRSIYFDSPSLDAIDEKITGVKTRKKLRVRGYDQFVGDNMVFLEVKRKQGNRITKNRSLVPFLHLKDILTFGLDSKLEESLQNRNQLDDANRFLFLLKKNNQSPVNLIVYDREAYHGKFNDEVRVTLDKNIRSKIFPSPDDLFDNDDLNYVWENHFILEVKYFFPPMPGWMKLIIEEFKLEASALSKYTEGYLCHKIIADIAI